MGALEYDPLAGLTINQAIANAKKMARAERCTVVADINDILMIINEQTDVDKAVDLYQDKLNFKYEIEMMRRKMGEKTK